MRTMLALLLCFTLPSAAQACAFGEDKMGSTRLYYEVGEFLPNAMTDATLDAVTSQLVGCRVILVVSGYADAAEIAVVDKMGLLRADTVRKSLEARGFAPVDILMRDLKFSRPVVATAANVEAAENRYVELHFVTQSKIVPMGETQAKSP